MRIRDNRKANCQKRHHRIRRRLFGTPERPRLAVFKSLNHIYAQIIDDRDQKTLVCASTVEKDVKDALAAGGLKSGGNVKAASMVGKILAERAAKKSIQAVAFDRGGNLYFGRVQALANAAREAGLKF